MALTTPQRVAASSEVGTSGRRKNVKSVHLAAGAGAAARAIFHNSTANNNPVWELAAIAGGGDAHTFGESAVFDKGCFVELSGVGAIGSVEFIEQ